MLVSPGEVFEDVVASPPRLANWLVPLLLVCRAAIVFPGETVGAQAWSSGGRVISSLATCLGVFAGTFWSAFVLWFIGRVFLKTRFPFVKAVGVVGLMGMILALGTIITGLLIVVTGDVAARPAMSFFAGKWGASAQMRAFLDMLNFFHFWTTMVLAIGLPRLSGVSSRSRRSGSLATGL